MNYISASYPLHQSDELFLQISSSSPHQHKIQQDTLQVIPSLDLPIKLDKIRSPNNDNGRCSEKKKIMHREIERQRRQEMNTLYASLRSLLPPEYLKGKRSISDHIDEAANYIKYLQKNIKELSNKKREKLKRLSNSSTPVTVPESLCPSEFVTVRSSGIGVEVVISSNLRDGVVMPLPRVLKLLVEEGFDVVNCVSSKVNDRLCHSIQSEVSDQAKVDASSLQQKLMDLVQSEIGFRAI